MSHLRGAAANAEREAAVDCRIADSGDEECCRVCPRGRHRRPQKEEQCEVRDGTRDPDPAKTRKLRSKRSAALAAFVGFEWEAPACQIAAQPRDTAQVSERGLHDVDA